MRQMRKYAKVLNAVLAAAMIFSAGCADGTESTEKTTSAQTENTQKTSAAETDVIETVAPDPDVSENSSAEEISLYCELARKNDYVMPEGSSVVLVGNSLTRFGDMPLYLEQMMEEKNITVTQECCDGYTFSDLYFAIKDKEEWLEALQNADAVVLQGYGGEYDAQAIDQILSEVKDLKHAYFFLTDFCVEDIENQTMTQEVSDGLRNTDITPVGWGFISSEMCGLFGEDIFYQTDGYHPTQINGCLTANLFYCVLTGESCQGTTFRQLPSTIRLFESEEQLNDLTMQAQKKIDEFYFETMGEQ